MPRAVLMSLLSFSAISAGVFFGARRGAARNVRSWQILLQKSPKREARCALAPHANASRRRDQMKMMNIH
jgi:hypothetical protein